MICVLIISFCHFYPLVCGVQKAAELWPEILFLAESMSRFSSSLEAALNFNLMLAILSKKKPNATTSCKNIETLRRKIGFLN